MYLAGALEALAQFTPDTRARQAVGHDELAFAARAEVLFTGLHRPRTRGNSHWTQIDTCVAVLAEIGLTAERKVDMAVFASPDKAQRLNLPHLGADAHASAAQYAIVIAEWVAYLLNAAAHCDVLDCP